MARMVPPEIPDDAPPSEKIIFENLKSAARSRDWVVFHSEYVDNPNNPARPREIDFLILIPDLCSVICLEAKGGSYEIRGGQWYALPSGNPVQSPPEQARTAMFALNNEFEATHLGRGSLLSLGCAVAFTDGELPRDARGPKQALIIERRAARDPESLCEMLLEYADEVRPARVVNRLRSDMGLQFGQAALADLQEELEQTVTITTRPDRIVRRDLETLRPQLLRLTLDQSHSLRRVRLNDRCVIDGAAGTGKTVLAMELARQLCEEDGAAVALVCSNPNLSRRFQRWTDTLSTESGGSVMAGTPTTLPLQVFQDSPDRRDRHASRLAGLRSLDDALKFGYLSNEWRPFIDETIADMGQGGVFDYLIVDEAQNLCDEVFLDLMDALLVGGLAGGRWVMFGDFTNQNIASPQIGTNGKDSLRSYGLHWSNDLLETNCRNTHEIAESVAKFVDIESPPISGVHGPLVQLEYFDSREDLETTLDRLIGSLKNRRFQSRQIILLSSGIGDEFNSERAYADWSLLNIREAELGTGEPLRDPEEVVSGAGEIARTAIRYSDVYDFQGLESDLAILVMPITQDQVALSGGVTMPRERHLNRVLYTGMTRAKAMLIIVAHESYREILESRASLYDVMISISA